MPYNHDIALSNMDRVTQEQDALLNDLIEELDTESGVTTTDAMRGKVREALDNEVLSIVWDTTPENARIGWVLALLQVVQA